MNVTGAPPLSLPTIILMTYSWFSMIIYANLIFILITKKNFNTTIQSPFFRLLVLNSIGDVMMFLTIEFIMRPRKYRFFGIFGAQPPQWFAYFSYFLLFTLKNSMDFSYIPIAINRMTATLYPRLHSKMWSYRNVICFVVFNWTFSILVGLIAVKAAPKGCHFVLLPSGTLQLLGEDMSKIDLFLSASSSATVTIICVICYSLAILGATKRQRKSAVALEIKFLLCAIFVTIPMVGECIRCVYTLYGTYAGHENIFISSAELWFYWTEVMTSFQCWSILIITPNIRRLMKKYGIFRYFFRKKPTVIISVHTIK